MTRPAALPRFGFLTCILITATCASVRADVPATDAPTALDRYVAAPDPAYRYELVNTLPGDGFTASVLRLTSQKWLTEKEVDHPVWQHWLTIVRPARVNSSKGM